MKNKDLPAIKFYESIKGMKEDFKLINGFFVVKYLNNRLCYFVCYFHKAKSVLNSTKINRVEFIENPSFLQFFDTKEKLTMTSLKVWRPLNIGWREEPIEQILK
jgi:hypothetical protein